MDFMLNPLEVGNIPTIGMFEEIEERKVKDCCGYIYRTYGKTISFKAMNNAMRMYDINYNSLPNWLKNEFDYFDIED